MQDRICVFDDVYNDASARAQADREKAGCFGMLSQIKLWDRPKDADITLVSNEKRYEPFWHVAAERNTHFTKQAAYTIHLVNPHAESVELLGQSRPRGPKGDVQLGGVELCRRKAESADFFEGLQRTIPEKQLSEYVHKHPFKEVVDNAQDQFVTPTVTAAFVLQQVKSRMMVPIDADEIREDTLDVLAMTLYYRPVYAFAYSWRDKQGVIEIDGLTGRVNKEGDLLGNAVRHLSTRENLFDVGIEIANVIVPGGGVLLRIVDKLGKK